MSDVIQGAGAQSALDKDKPDSAIDMAGLQRRWVMQIERFERKAQTFYKRGKKIEDRYTAEKKDEETTTARYNVLWSNMQVLKPALYAKDPTPEVERRFKDKDPVGRVAADVLERCATFLISKQGFGDTMKQVVLDRLLPGRGIAWVRYVPHMRDAQVQGDADVREDGSEVTDQVPLEEVYWEEVKFDFVNWRDFGHTVGRHWEELDAVWRIAYLDRDELKKRFGEKGALVPLDEVPDGMDKATEGGEILHKGKVYEIWDKRTKRAIWINKGMAEPLDVLDDPLRLEGFFPCPKLLQATTSNSSYIPTADYIQYVDQAAELDRLTNRITSLTRAVKVAGVYDSSVPALQRMLSGGAENQLIPVPTWAAFAEKGGLKGGVELLPVQEIASVLLQLYEARDKVKQDLYEISGLSDLLRGANDAAATATAEQIKANFASVRLKDMQRDVQEFARALIRMASEIVAEHFSVETIKQMCGIKLLTNAEKQMLQQQMAMFQQVQQAIQAQQQSGQPAPPMPQIQPPNPEQVKLLREPSWEDVEALLRDNAARQFRIDIETDSTIAQDEHAEQQQRLEFAKTVGTLIGAAMPVVQELPTLAPAFSETVMFVLRAFRVGRSTESAFQEAMDKLGEMAGQPPQKKQGDESGQAMLQVEQIKQQGQNQQAQVSAQADLQKIQMQHQFDMEKMQAEQQHQLQLESAKVHASAQIEQYKANLEHERETARHQAEHQFKMASLTTKAASREAAEMGGA